MFRSVLYSFPSFAPLSFACIPGLRPPRPYILSRRRVRLRCFPCLVCVRGHPAPAALPRPFIPSSSHPFILSGPRPLHLPFPFRRKALRISRGIASPPLSSFVLLLRLRRLHYLRCPHGPCSPRLSPASVAPAAHLVLVLAAPFALLHSVCSFVLRLPVYSGLPPLCRPYPSHVPPHRPVRGTRNRVFEKERGGRTPAPSHLRKQLFNN